MGATITGRRRSPCLAYFITAYTQWGATVTFFRPQVPHQVVGAPVRGAQAGALTDNTLMRHGKKCKEIM